MKAITRFDMRPLFDINDPWGEHSQLIFNGNQTSTVVPGRQLLRQYEMPSGYLLVTDFNCPFEEQTHFLLLDHRFRVLSDRTLGVPTLSVASNRSFLLKDIEWLDDRHFIASSHWDTDEKWIFTIRSFGLPYFFPRLAIKRIPPFPQ